MTPADFADLAVRGTAWLAMAGYFLGAFLILQTHGARPRFPATLWVWAIGCDFYFWHVIAAFHFAHDWSHAAAVQSVNERALDFTGQSAPYGIWFNYVFLAAWIIDAAWLWSDEESYLRRRRALNWGLHGFLLFMVINGAIVFAPDYVRWPSIVALAVLAWVWFTSPARGRT